MLIQDSSYIAALDACVLAPMPVCDTLLRLAERNLFIPKWSKQILGEVASTLTKMGYSQAQILRRISTMNAAFPDAIVTGHDSLIPAMMNHEKDRHVLAVAVLAGAHAIVTEDRNGFLRPRLHPMGSYPSRPTSFLYPDISSGRTQWLKS